MTLALTHPAQQHLTEPAPLAATRLGETARVLLGVGALAYLTALATLLAWSVLPVLLGWSAYVVQSGSMMPAIRPGDVLVSAPVDGSPPLRHGQIVVVDDPAQPGRLLSHRVARVRDDGFVVTRGDANDHVDSTPVPPDAVQGRARLLVPYIGLPQRWLVSGEWLLLAGGLALTCLAVGAVATDPSRAPKPPQPRHRALPPDDPRRGRRRRGTLWPGARVSPVLRVAVTVLLFTAVIVTVLGDGVDAAFRKDTGNPGNAFAARPDFVAPDASAVTVYKTKGYLTGAVQPAGPYQVYANVTDTGSPPSGTASVRADLSQLTAGAGSTALNGGNSAVGGVSYNHSTSPQLTTGVAGGTKNYSLTMTDVAGFSRTRGYNVTVDGIAPTAANVDATNVPGGTVGKPESGDSYVLTFSERIDPYSVLDGWTGAARPVVLVIQRVGASNSITVSLDGVTQLPLGQTVTDRERYTQSQVNFTGSTMTQSGNTITVVLGTPSGSINTTTDLNPFRLEWRPSGTPYDAAGNLMSTASAVESGTNDVDF